MDDSHYLPFSRVAAASGSPAGAPVLGGQAPGSSLLELASCPSLLAWPAQPLRRAGGLGQLYQLFLLPAVPRLCSTREPTLPASGYCSHPYAGHPTRLPGLPLPQLPAQAQAGHSATATPHFLQKRCCK